LRSTGRVGVGPSPDVLDLRARGLLRLQPAPPRDRALRPLWTPGDALRRTRRELALVLPRSTPGL